MPTALGLDGTAVHQSKTAGLPMPPPVSGRAVPAFNGNGQYRLPHPETGKLTSYTRASTVAKTLEDTWMLDAWARRMMLLGLWDYPDRFKARLDQIIEPYLADGGARGTAMARELRSSLNDIGEDAQFAAGSKAAAEFGTATHAWCEWVDHGGWIWDVPEMFRPWVIAHRRVLAENGLMVHPNWTERVVLNTQYGIAGTLDRLFWNHRGELFLGDIKTSRGMDYSWLYFAIQLAIYHGSSHVLSLDGTHWEPMPPLDPDTVLVMHLPRDEPEASRIVPLNMSFGAEALHTAMTVRRLRSAAEKRAQSVPYRLGLWSTSSEARIIMARHLIEVSRTEEELARIWESYQDIWTDDLTALGRISLRSANANASA